jgi:hypothetical protein
LCNSLIEECNLDQLFNSNSAEITKIKHKSSKITIIMRKSLLFGFKSDNTKTSKIVKFITNYKNNEEIKDKEVQDPISEEDQRSKSGERDMAGSDVQHGYIIDLKEECKNFNLLQVKQLLQDQLLVDEEHEHSIAALTELINQFQVSSDTNGIF